MSTTTATTPPLTTCQATGKKQFDTTNWSLPINQTDQDLFFSRLDWILCYSIFLRLITLILHSWNLCFFQGMDRSAVLVCIAALGFFCILTGISVHCTQMYKGKTQTCQEEEEEEEGSCQANSPAGSLTCMLQWYFFGKHVSPCDVCGFIVSQGSLITRDQVWGVWVIMYVSMFTRGSHCSIYETGHHIIIWNDSFAMPPPTQKHIVQSFPFHSLPHF